SRVSAPSTSAWGRKSASDNPNIKACTRFGVLNSTRTVDTNPSTCNKGSVCTLTCVGERRLACSRPPLTLSGAAVLGVLDGLEITDGAVIVCKQKSVKGFDRAREVF